jgi:alanine racemase
VIDTVSIDSRSLQNSEHTLFCIGWSNNDAHAYIEDLIATGCKTLWCYVFRKDAQVSTNFLIVENTSLPQHLPIIVFYFPVIGLGSNGKR